MEELFKFIASNQKQEVDFGSVVARKVTMLPIILWLYISAFLSNVFRFTKNTKRNVNIF